MQWSSGMSDRRGGGGACSLPSRQRRRPSVVQRAQERVSVLPLRLVHSFSGRLMFVIWYQGWGLYWYLHNHSCFSIPDPQVALSLTVARNSASGSSEMSASE